jgi:hypothetical protein
MPTEAQLNANRANAQKSTGPLSEAGKAASSRNRLTLGLYTQRDYVTFDERDLYTEFCDTMHLELSPEGLLEGACASEITGATWRLRRCSNAEYEVGSTLTIDPLLDALSGARHRSGSYAARRDSQ